MKEYNLKKDWKVLHNDANSAKSRNNHTDEGNPLKNNKKPEYLTHWVSIVEVHIAIPVNAFLRLRVIESGGEKEPLCGLGDREYFLSFSCVDCEPSSDKSLIKGDKIFESIVILEIILELTKFEGLFSKFIDGEGKSIFELIISPKVLDFLIESQEDIKPSLRLIVDVAG